MAESAKRLDENSNLIKEIQAAMDAAIRNQGASIKTLEIQIGNFCVVTDFEVVENMDVYRDEEMGDVIVGEPFCRASCVKTRCKHLTNAQCNKMRPLLKVSARDKLNGISHPYQLLKSFYKGILNLGPKYDRDEKIEERLTRGHVSMNEME
ncbi:hypothetical protein Tco_0573588 [Tanacetum coccineum]